MGARMTPEQTQARYSGRADGIADAMFKAIRNQAYAKPSFLSLMTFKIQQRVWQQAIEDSLDHEYWRSRGWTENNREYYIRHGANAVKVRFARLTGSLIARFVT